MRIVFIYFPIYLFDNKSWYGIRKKCNFVASICHATHAGKFSFPECLKYYWESQITELRHIFDDAMKNFCVKLAKNIMRIVAFFAQKMLFFPYTKYLRECHTKISWRVVLHYDLHGICVHSGTGVYGGHYYGYFRYGSEWFLFHGLFDPNVEHVDAPREVLKQLQKGRIGAYGLLYCKRWSEDSASYRVQ